MIVISPHLDDAVFSVGQIIAAHPGTTVVTVFAGIPAGGFLTPYDESAGFDSSADSVRARRAEDIDAVTALGGKVIHGPFLDGAHTQQRVTGGQVALWLRTLKLDPNEDTLYPWGISHPDHVAVANAAPKNALRYEELPYRVQYPEQTPCAQRHDFWGLMQLPSADVAAKHHAVECYRSQMSTSVRQCVYVPERVWGHA